MTAMAVLGSPRRTIIQQVVRWSDDTEASSTRFARRSM